MPLSYLLRDARVRPFVSLWLGMAVWLWAVPFPAVTGAELSTEAAAALVRVRADVSYLASDELEGRGPGTDGLQKAADFLREQFREIGLRSGVEDGSYFQPFEITLGESVVPEKTHLVLKGPDGSELPLELDAAFRPFFTGEFASVSAPLVFVGYGISAPDLKYDDYRDLDVEGKIVVLIRREPQQDDPKSAFDGRKVTSHSYLITKLKQAADRKAAAVLLVNDPFTVKKSENHDDFMPPQSAGLRNAKIPFAQLTIATLDRILSQSPLRAGTDAPLTSVEAIETYIDQHVQPVSQPLEGWSARLAFSFKRETARVANVVGVLDGEGPLADETVVIGAHYDHLGYGGFGSRRPSSREIHNGADDNASGTAALLEIARRFVARGEKPARRVVFIGFSAEERGLIGSNHYAGHPLFPLEKTVAMINFDMIGTLRNDEVELHGVGSGKGFDEIADAAIKLADIKVKKISGVIPASDHFSFYQKKIPVCFFFTGLTDLYHTPDDDVSQLNLEGLVRVIQFAEPFCWMVVQRPERLDFADAPAPSRRPGRGLAYLGVVPDYNAQVEGLQVSEAKANSPAEKGGIVAGDVIIQIGEVAVSDIEGMSEGLRRYRPGETVTIVVKRNGEEKSLTVKLGEPGSN